MSFTNFKKYIKEQNAYSLRDRYDLPKSELTFVGGANCRIEISVIEGVSNLHNGLEKGW